MRSIVSCSGLAGAPSCLRCSGITSRRSTSASVSRRRTTEARSSVTSTVAGRQIQDPLTGTQTTLIGLFLARLANYIFVTAGGLMLLTGILLESYYLWPLDQKLPDIEKVGLEQYASEFSYYFQLAVLIASPMIIVILLIDVMMGLINRYAQQFNVFFLSLSLKMLAAISMLFLTIVALIQLLIRELHQHFKNIHDIINNLFII